MLSIQLLFPEDFFPHTAGSQAASHQNAVHIQLSDRPAQHTTGINYIAGRTQTIKIARGKQGNHEKRPYPFFRFIAHHRHLFHSGSSPDRRHRFSLSKSGDTLNGQEF